MEYVDSGSEASSPHGYFQIDFVGVDVRATLADAIRARFEARFTPEEVVDVQQANLRIRDLPLDGFLTVGLRQRLMKPRRKTESYPLAGTAFWKGQDIGLFGGVDLPFLESDDLELALVAEGSLTNGPPLGRRRIGEDPSFRIIGYEEQNRDGNASKEVGYNAGVKGKIADTFRFDLMTFGYTSRLTDDDLDFLAGVSGYGTETSRDDFFYGAAARGRVAGLTIYSQVCKGRVGLLGRAAWYVQGSYKVGLGDREILKSVEPLVRYGVLDLDIPEDPADPRTWDRDRLTTALILEVLDELDLKMEYSINGETTGDSEVRNDELVLQMQVQF